MNKESAFGRLLNRLSSGQGDTGGTDTMPKLRMPLGMAVAQRGVPQATGRRVVLQPGTQFAHFRIEEELGRGAMAAVYRATDQRDGRTVALKLLSLGDDWPEDKLADARLRLLREAEAASRIDHPDIVKVFDAGEAEGLVYLNMEFVEGVNLATHAGSGRQLPPRMVCEMCARVAEALHYAHERGIVHRDVKPANIVFDQTNRRVRIMDFGVARFTDSQATRTGIVLGSPSFMAPEQLQGLKVDGRSDQFSLGVTLFQLLTGSLPFRSDSIAGLMKAILDEPHPPLSSIRPDLPACVGSILDRAMAKNPSQRFGSALEFGIALRDCGRTIPATLR